MTSTPSATLYDLPYLGIGLGYRDELIPQAQVDVRAEPHSWAARVLDVRLDMGVALPLLRQRSPVEPSPIGCTYLFVKRGDLLGRVFRIDPSTRHVWDRCDGSRSVSTICRELTLPADDVARRVQRLIREGALV